MASVKILNIQHLPGGSFNAAALLLYILPTAAQAVGSCQALLMAEKANSGCTYLQCFAAIVAKNKKQLRKCPLAEGKHNQKVFP